MTGIRSWVWAVLLCAAGLAATVNAAPADVGYAPPESDLIVRVNGPKIFRSQTFALLRGHAQVKKFEADMRKDLADIGMTVDDLLNTDIFLFGSTGGFDIAKPVSFSVIARNPKAFSAAILAYVSDMGDEDKPESLKKDPICGKEARVYREEDATVAAVALDKDLVFLQFNAIPTALPVLRQPGELGKMVEPEAMVSIAFRNPRGVGKDVLEILPQVVEPLLHGVTFVKADLYDRGDRVAIEAELVYPTPEIAQNAARQFNSMLLLGAMALQKEHPEKTRVMRKVKIACDGNKVVIRFSCRNEELAKAFLK